MRKVCFALALAALLAAPGLTIAEDAPAAPAAPATTAPAATEAAAPAPKELTDTITKAVALLEGDKFKEFIQLLAPPGAVKPEELDETVKQFTAHKDEMVKGFKALLKINPTLKGDEATYTGADIDSMTFIKIKDRWYLKG